MNGEDRQANDKALREGARLLSAYLLKDGSKTWIISEAIRVPLQTPSRPREPRPR
jgi:hypothetical protein